MPKEGNLIVSFDRFTAFEIQLGFNHDRWLRQWPVYIAYSFPHAAPDEYIASLVKPPIYEDGAAGTVAGSAGPAMVVSLLFSGLLLPFPDGWKIGHPRYPQAAIPIPSDSDLFLTDNIYVSPKTVLKCLHQLLLSRPPSSLVRPQEN